MRTWSRRRIVISVCVVVLLVWIVAVSWLLLGARSSVRSGTAHLRAVRQQASISTLVEPQSAEDLDQASSDFDDAAAKLDSPLLWPLRVLPIAGRHVRAADDLVASAQDGTEAAGEALDDLVALTEQPHQTGPQRLETLASLAAIAKRTEGALAAIDPGSPDSLIGPLGDAVEEMGEQRDEAEQAAARLEAVSLAVADVLDGPEPYLLLGANNAEMRNGSGMFLSASELGFDQGSLDLGEVAPTADLVLPEGSVPVDGDLAANWPWIDSGRDLRNLGLTADFPQSAEIAVANWAATPGASEVGGAIVLDVDAIRSLLRVVGPVEVDGISYTAENVRGELLRKQYQRYDGDREARRDQLGGVARAIFERIEAGEWELADLATELADAVQGRHLMVWSADPKVQDAWAEVHADGHLSDDSVSIGLLNRSANKLDSWIDASATLESDPAEDDRRALTITYEVTNDSSGEGPAYLVGPNVEGLEAGDHKALVVVNLPAGTTDVTMEGAEAFLAGGDGPTVVAGGEVVVRKGQTVTVTVRAMLPEGLDQVTIEPSARIPRTAWRVDGTEIERDRRRSFDLD